MKKVLLIILLVQVSVCQLYAQNAKSDSITLNVLLIGNSFSGNSAKYFPQLSKEVNGKFKYTHASMGGCTLQRHWDSVMAFMADTNRGRAYQDKSLIQLLSTGVWDIVTIQQASHISGNENTYEPYARYLFDLIKKYQPAARIVIHETWPYRADAKKFSQVSDTAFAKTQKEMYNKLFRAYRSLAKELNTCIIPTGDAFYNAATDKKWAFKEDTSFNPTTAVYPALPGEENSLNIGYYWDKKNKLMFDPNHANDAGCYLAGLVWMGTLFHKDPASFSFAPAGINDEFAAFLRQTASKVVRENPFR